MALESGLLFEIVKNGRFIKLGTGLPALSYLERKAENLAANLSRTASAAWPMGSFMVTLSQPISKTKSLCFIFCSRNSFILILTWIIRFFYCAPNLLLHDPFYAFFHHTCELRQST
jgi:hypothetical protein